MGRGASGREGGISRPWAIAAAVAIALIWTNSLVPGDTSTSTSTGIMVAVRSALASLGLPSAWVTNLLVRKLGHLLEYAALGVLVSQALDPDRSLEPVTFIPIAIVLVLVPSVDETIQLFVPGRSGQVTDVLLDCCGAALGVALRSLAIWLAKRRRANP